MLHTCYLYSTQYNVLFNANKSSASAIILSVCPSLLCARSAIHRSLLGSSLQILCEEFPDTSEA